MVNCLCIGKSKSYVFNIEINIQQYINNALIFKIKLSH